MNRLLEKAFNAIMCFVIALGFTLSVAMSTGIMYGIALLFSITFNHIVAVIISTAFITLMMLFICGSKSPEEDYYE